MVKATSLDMSLSDIISKNKKTKKVIRKTAGGIKKRPSIGKAAAKGTPRRRSGGIRNLARQQAVVITPNGKRNVRINVSNLAPTVVSTDLHELFGEFKLNSVVVNFNEKGAPLGTGDISLSKNNADRLIQKFAGVALDGKVMQFALIETSNVASRTSFQAKAAPRGPKPQNRRNSAGPVGKATKSPKAGGAKPQKKAGLKKKKPAKEEKPKKTAEELDAELDAYMSRGN